MIHAFGQSGGVRLLKNPPDEFSDMQGKCLSTFFPHLVSTNLAVSGSTSGEHVRQQLSRLPSNISNSIAFVVMTTGGNDLIHNYGRTAPREEAAYGATLDEAAPWITNFEARLDIIVQQITNHFPAGCHIFLCTIFDPTDNVGDAQNAGLPAWKAGLKILRAYNDAIRNCVRRHKCVHVVEVHDAFLGHGIHCTRFWLPRYDRKDPHFGITPTWKILTSAGTTRSADSCLSGWRKLHRNSVNGFRPCRGIADKAVRAPITLFSDPPLPPPDLMASVDNPNA